MFTVCTRGGGSTESWLNEVIVWPGSDAVNETAVVVVTGWVVMEKLTLVAPAGTVTLAGTAAAAGSLLARETTVPEAGAGNTTSTVPTAGVPPNVPESVHAEDPHTSRPLCLNWFGRLSTTLTGIVTLWLSDPLVAVTVTEKVPSGTVLSALSCKVVSVPLTVTGNPPSSMTTVVLSVMVVEAAVCEVTPAGRPLSWKLTVPRKPLSKPSEPIVSTCRTVLTQAGAPDGRLPRVFGWVSPPVQLLLLSQVGRPPRTRYTGPKLGNAGF